MSVDPKNDLLTSVKVKLASEYDEDVIHKVSNVLCLELDNYDVIAKTREIVASEQESRMMIKMFLATKKLEGSPDTTLKLYNGRLNEILNYVRKPFNTMTTNDLRSYLVYKEVNGVSLRTVGNYRNIMTSFFGWATRENLISQNPTDTLGQIKHTKKIELPFTGVELDTMRTQCESIKYRAMMELFLSTGCRVEEVVQMKISDVDFQAKEIKVHGKGNKERIVFFNDITSSWLKKYLNTRTDDNTALFMNKNYKPLKKNGIGDWYKRFGNRCGVSRVHPHKFRRTFATTMINRGMGVEQVAMLLGHANLNTTMGYVYIAHDVIKEAYNRYID